MEKIDYKNGDVRQILSGNGIILAGKNFDLINYI